MTVAEAQRRISPIEYLRRRLMFDIEAEENWKKQERADFYDAQTAFQVYLLRHAVLQMFAKHPKSPDLEFKNFVFDFTKGLKKKKKKIEEEARVNCLTEPEDDDEWGDTLELEETEEERNARFEEANLNAHNRWAGFLGVTLSQVGADQFVKSPDEIASRSEEDDES